MDFQIIRQIGHNSKDVIKSNDDKKTRRWGSINLPNSR
jgi:hypothetical protein